MPTVTFRQGVNSAGFVYSGAVDTMLMQASAATASGAAATIGVDTGTNVDQQMLMRFGALFGDGPGQIPLGATITSATLTLRTTNATVQGPTLRRLLTPWDNASTWSSLGSGVQTDGTEAVTAPDQTLGAVASGSTVVDVATSLQ